MQRILFVLLSCTAGAVCAYCLASFEEEPLIHCTVEDEAAPCGVLHASCFNTWLCSLGEAPSTSNFLCPVHASDARIAASADAAVSAEEEARQNAIMDDLLNALPIRRVQALFDRDTSTYVTICVRVRSGCVAAWIQATVCNHIRTFMS